MSSYAKNNYRADKIRRFGETIGLPLFESGTRPSASVGAIHESPPLRRPSPTVQARFKAAPKSIPTGAETRHLSFILMHGDQLRLSLLCQQVWESFAEFGPASNSEIAQRLGKESGWISARNNDLRKLNLLADAGKRKCNVTGEIVTVWKAI